MEAWLSWLEHTVHIREVTGSSPVASTTRNLKDFSGCFFVFRSIVLVAQPCFARTLRVYLFAMSATLDVRKCFALASFFACGHRNERVQVSVKQKKQPLWTAHCCGAVYAKQSVLRTLPSAQRNRVLIVCYVLYARCPQMLCACVSLRLRSTEMNEFKSR